MKILITGSDGYVGKALIRTLNLEHQLLLINYADKYTSKDNIFYLDLLNNEHIDRFNHENIEFELMIHTASRMASSSNINDISILLDNIKMYENLTSLALKHNPVKIINFSSMAVYPNTDGSFSEESPVNPSYNNDAFYGLSKVCGENILNFRLRNLNIKIIHLRIGQIYSDEMRDDRLYKMMKDELMRCNTITVFGEGERVSNFIHIDELMQDVNFFIEKDLQGIFNVGRLNCTYKDFARLIINKYGNDKSQIVLFNDGLKTKFFLNIDKLNSLKG